MKINKLTAVGATLALTVGSVFGFSLAASAAEVPVSIDDIGQEVPGGGYPADQWFVGDPAGPDLIQTEDGLTIPGRNQLLYGVLEAGVTADEFAAFIEAASFEGTGPLVFQVPVFLGPGTAGFTTLQPTSPGTPSTETTWMSSRTVGGLTAFEDYTFDEILDEFVGENASVLAFGVFVGPGETAVLNSVTVGEETWTFATPAEPVDPTTPPVAPTTPPVAPVPTPVQGAATFTG